ncbi:GNAT family N-acetyltransferase [candidate division LCP-89 bacterium B3_LCP]|uniref:GNAT family N-acetyltransferase n=1 Tax=candidate division LCP-89 bacterium B3_LCP TaxID=2012998 RepID=A0A532V027_UNCL8|nr:MAG: GNAT family N-acetyltransferase [candidate division LCP-89 bacterium B3_LCP]
MEIELTTTPSAEDARTISQGLVDFNHEMVHDLDPEETEIKFSVLARDYDGEVTGGLRATCFWNTLHIELIWVSKEARGSGIGSSMVKKAELFAIKHGFEQALLETTSWQARPFYEKLGYELLATLPEYPKGHACHFLTKKLAEK